MTNRITEQLSMIAIQLREPQTLKRLSIMLSILDNIIESKETKETTKLIAERLSEKIFFKLLSEPKY